LRYTDVSELVLFPIILYVLYPVIMCYDVSSVVLCNFLQCILLKTWCKNNTYKQHIQCIKFFIFQKVVSVYMGDISALICERLPICIATYFTYVGFKFLNILSFHDSII